MLGLRIYKLPYTQDYKWWDGYIDEIAVHIEEMDTSNKMSIGKMKEYINIMPIKVEKRAVYLATSDLYCFS